MGSKALLLRRFGAFLCMQTENDKRGKSDKIMGQKTLTDLLAYAIIFTVSYN